MNTSDLIFIGIKGSVVALNRTTGERVWATHLKGSDFVNVTVQPGAIVATCYGEVFCLDPLTGDSLWHNPLKGFGLDLSTIASEYTPQGSPANTMAAAKRRRDQQAAAAASAAA